MRFDAQALKRARTEHAKQMRRIYADNSGRLKFGDKWTYPGQDDMSNTITTFFSKDSLIIEFYES